MHEINTSAIVPYTWEQLFHLVNDVAPCAVFLSRCSHASVLDGQSDHGIESVQAQLGIKFGVIEQFLVTRNTPHSPYRIVMELEKGPFRS